MPRCCRKAESVPKGTIIGVTIAPGWYFRIAARMARNSGVSMGLMATSGAVLMISIETRGSLIRAFISEINSSELTPGSSRQSRLASAVEGITLALGGEPTPDVRVVSEIVLRWIAE